MALRDKLRANVAPYLQEGETVQAVFRAQTVSQYWSLLSFWIILLSDAYRVVAVTDRRILILKSSRLGTAKVTGVIGEVPRNTRLGPVTGLWYRLETLGDRMYVHRRFASDVAAADALLPAA